MFESSDPHFRISSVQKILFLKKRLPGVGSEPGASQFHLFLLFTTLPLSHSGSPFKRFF
jgi:hypothetical protein